MTFLVNTSPFAGREGKFVTSRNIKVWCRGRPPLQLCSCASLLHVPSPGSGLGRKSCQMPLCTIAEDEVMVALVKFCCL